MNVVGIRSISEWKQISSCELSDLTDLSNFLDDLVSQYIGAGLRWTCSREELDHWAWRYGKAPIEKEAKGLVFECDLPK